MITPASSWKGKIKNNVLSDDIISERDMVAAGFIDLPNCVYIMVPTIIPNNTTTDFQTPENFLFIMSISSTKVIANQKWKFSIPVEFSNKRFIITGASVSAMSNKITTMIRGVKRKLILDNNPLTANRNKKTPPIATEVYITE